MEITNIFYMGYIDDPDRGTCIYGKVRVDKDEWDDAEVIGFCLEDYESNKKILWGNELAVTEPSYDNVNVRSFLTEAEQGGLVDYLREKVSYNLIIPKNGTLISDPFTNQKDPVMVAFGIMTGIIGFIVGWFLSRLWVD